MSIWPPAQQREVAQMLRECRAVIFDYRCNHPAGDDKTIDGIDYLLDELGASSVADRLRRIANRTLDGSFPLERSDADALMNLVALVASGASVPDDSNLARAIRRVMNPQL